MKKAVVILLAILLIVPTIAAANPFTRYFANRLTNRVMAMIEPRIAEIVERAPVSPAMKSDMTRQLNDAARRIVDSEIQNAMGGKMPKPAGIVNKVVSELNTIAQNIIRGGANGLLTGNAQAAQRVKPRLRIEPFTLWGYNDSDMETIITMLATHDSLQMAYNIVDDNAEYVLVTEVRSLGNMTVLVMRILNVDDSSQVASGNISFGAIEEVVEQLSQLGSRFAASAPIEYAEQTDDIFIDRTVSPSTVIRGTFTDSRDWRTYRTVTIGEQTWMAENLNFLYGNFSCSGNNCRRYGRLYDWNTAMTVCPVGWHLPSDEEWAVLIDAVGGSGTRLKSNKRWRKPFRGTDDYGFSALPWALGFWGYWWTATEREGSTTHAWHRYMSNTNENVSSHWRSKENMFSVRCIKSD